MQIDKNSLDQFLKDFKLAMESLEEKYDVTISLGRVTYTDQQFSAKMTVDNGRDPEEIAKANFDKEVWRYEHLGLRPGMYNRIFKGADGKMYAIQGFNPRSHKYPLHFCRVEDGEKRRSGEGFLKEILNEYYIESITID